MIQIVVSSWQQNNSARTSRKHTPSFTTVTIPIAYLGLFRIGDLWNGGRKIGTDNGFAQETFRNLEINENTITVAPAGLPIHPDGVAALYPLPFSAFEAHRTHTGAFCGRVRVADNITLVVPCMELIRFYFGSSGSLLKQLFSGALTANKLYTSAKINPSTGIARLELAPSLPGVAASTVGRIAFDTHARKAMRWLINSGVSAAAHGERHYPRTTFPFAGSTDLTALGRWIELYEHRVFLAERLIRCTHPFPFQTLFYTSHINRFATRQAVRNALDRKKALAASGADGRSTFQLTEARVASNLQPAAVVAGEENDCPFPDLLAKRIRRIKEDRPVFARKAASSENNVLAAGESSTTSGIRAAEITTDPIEEEVEEFYPQGVQLVQDICQELMSAGADFVRLLPTWDIDTNIEQPFNRATDLVSNSDPRLEKIWTARLTIRAPHVPPSLLLLIKEKELWWSEDSREHVILFPYSPNLDPQRLILEKRLIEFANMGSRPGPNEGAVKGEMQIGTPYGVDRMFPYLTGVWSLGHEHYGE